MTDIKNQSAAVTYNAANGVGYLTLSRPERLNALDGEMADALVSRFRQAVAAADTRVIVFQGSGRSFCAGGDISYFRQFGDQTDDMIDSLLPGIHEMLIEIENADKVVIMSVHGAVAGAGMSFSFMGDFCVAEAGTRFVPAYRGIGVTPDMGGTIGLTRAVGERNTLRLLLAEDWFDVQTAHDLGLVTKIAAQGELESVTVRFAERFAGSSADAVLETRRLVRQAVGARLPEQLDREMIALKSRMGSIEYRTWLKSLDTN